MAQKGATRFMLVMFGLMAFSFIIIGLWNSVPAIKNGVNYVLNPTLGVLINWNLTWGTLIAFLIIAFITTIIQKYATDQETLKELKQEQKDVQKEMNKYKDDPKKMLEFQKSLWPTSMKIMELSMKSSLFTLIPFVLLFRWFMDVFDALGSPHFFGFLNWFWFYLLSVLIFSGIFRKILKVA